MKILNVKMVNWKCFKHKIFEFNCANNLELVIGKNGSGKSSLFEAILYSFFGKLPSGFNYNTIRNNDEKESIVEVNFINSKNQLFRITRKFGGNNGSISILEELNNILDDVGTTIATGAGNVNNFIEQMLGDRNLISSFWTENLVDSEILKPSFLFDNVFKEIFKDSEEILSYYKSDNYYISREIKQKEKDLELNIYKNEENDANRDYDAVKDELEKLKNELENIVKNDDSLLSKAKMANIAYLENEKIKEEINSYKSKDILSQDDILTLKSIVQKYKNTSFPSCLYKELVQEKENKLEELKKLQKDVKENGDVNYAFFSLNLWKNIFDEQKNHENCIICNNKIKEHEEFCKNRYNEIFQQFETNKNLRIVDKIKNEDLPRLEKDILILKKFKDYNFDIISISEKFANNEVAIARCKNFKEILERHSDESDKKWKQFQKLNDELEILKVIENTKNELTKLNGRYQDNAEKIQFINGYIKNAQSYFIQEVLKISSEKYLKTINQRYENISIMDNSYHLIAKDQELNSLSILPVFKLSKGEKTMVSVSLILAIHEIFIPELPMLFDETFSSLDIENVEKIKNILNMSSKYFQIFVITHSKDWIEEKGE